MAVGRSRSIIFSSDASSDRNALECGRRFRYHRGRGRRYRAPQSRLRTGSFAVNIHTKTTTDAATAMSPAEWQARVDLAAVYRLVAHHGWDDGIYNHCSMRVPGEDRKLLMKRHELLWTEVTASNLVKVSMDEDLDERAGVNRPGFTLHGGVLRGRGDVNCAVHVHTRTGMAIAGLKSGLRMISQEAVRFFGS